MFVALGAPAGLQSQARATDIMRGLDSLSCSTRALRSQEKNKKVLVLVHLRGGNDGLSMIVPYNSSIYYAKRGELAIAAEAVLPIDNSLGFNPAMSELHTLYKTGRMAVLPSVGYPQPSRSHFRASDIWHTASTENIESDGWAGRLLDWQQREKILPIDSTEVAGRMVTPMACSLDREIPLVLRSTKLPENAVRSFPELDESCEQTDVMGSIDRRFHHIVRSLCSGSTSMIYTIGIDGFDTHAHQQRILPQLYKGLSVALANFQSAVEKNCPEHEVLTVVYSEFGRRLPPNECHGTDHGEAGPVLIVGERVRGQVYGSISFESMSATSPTVDVDFREVYATMLDKWFVADSSEILSGRFPDIGFIKA